MEYSAAQMFKYNPEAINLTGFPYSPLIDYLGLTLGREILLKQHQTEDGRRKIVTPSFPLEYIAQRQTFFQKLPNEKIKKYLFERGFPRKQKGRIGVEKFLYFCQTVYNTIEDAREELQDFNHIPEARRILKRFDFFDADLETTLKALHTIEETDTFAFHTKTGFIAPIAEMPDEIRKPCYQTEKKEYGNLDECLVDKIRVKMKMAALSMAKQGADYFKRRIIQFVEDEFYFNPHKDNLRKDFEQLAVPVRLYYAYKKFLHDEDEEETSEEKSLKIYPEFSDHYEIKGFFPLNLLGTWSEHKPVQINFETKPSEEKFLLAGLHSGGKSFFLENLVLASIIGQIPLRMPADILVQPKYKRIFYYRNQNNGGRGDGKLIDEIKATERIISQAEKGDVIFLDEFLDSVSTGTATYLVPVMLDRLEKSPATVFVSTHRGVDYKKLENKGWTIMSPEHKIEGGKVVPSHKLKRGIPNERINRRYVAEKCEKIINPKKEDDFDDED